MVTLFGGPIWMAYFYTESWTFVTFFDRLGRFSSFMNIVQHHFWVFFTVLYGIWVFIAHHWRTVWWPYRNLIVRYLAYLIGNRTTYPILIKLFFELRLKKKQCFFFIMCVYQINMRNYINVHPGTNARHGKQTNTTKNIKWPK